MLLAFLSDIHGNLPALRHALADARKRGATRIYCAGDLVGYGPFPDQVCRTLADEKITTVMGNYDAKVISLLHHSEDLKTRMKPGKLKILTWTSRHISRTSDIFLSGLPSFHRETLEGRFQLLVTHGSPIFWEDTVYPSITRYALEKKLANEKPNVLVCGHTHIPFVKKIAGITVLNCGSTGMPIDGDPNPSYALLQLTKTGALSGKIIRFSYPQEELLRAIESSSLPADLAKDFKSGNKKREKR